MCQAGYTIRMKQKILALLALLMLSPMATLAQSNPASQADAGWRPTSTMYCSDGEFDWDSGQSLYDFVILKRAPGDFLISYQGIPHPSFERRQYSHLWIKMVGHFSSSLETRGEVRIYRLKLELENEPARIGELTIAANDKYTFTMTPPLKKPVTSAGLCWDSLKPEPRALQKRRR
jgi:hypothetical protein